MRFGSLLWGSAGVLLGAALIYEAIAGQWRGQPPVHVQAAGLYPDSQDFAFIRDDSGLRGTIPVRDISVLSMGGVWVEQPYLPEPLTWQQQLGRLLQDDAIRASLGNGGRAGHSLGDLRRSVDLWSKNLKPKFVLLMVDDPSVPPHPPDRRSPKSRSALYRAVFGPYQDIPPPSPSTGADRAMDPAGRQEFHEILQKIHLWGAVPVIITVPGFPRLNRSVLDVCQQDGLVCLNMADDVAWQPEDHLAGGGFTPKGADKAAQWLYSRLGRLI